MGRICAKKKLGASLIEGQCNFEATDCSSGATVTVCLPCNTSVPLDCNNPADCFLFGGVEFLPNGEPAPRIYFPIDTPEEVLKAFDEIGAKIAYTVMNPLPKKKL